MSELLDRFQKNFIEYINLNYSSCTEDDLNDKFAELREKMTDLVLNTANDISKPHTHNNGISGSS